MGLQDALRKAAGLLIEQQNEKHNAPPSDEKIDALLATAEATSADLDAALDVPKRPGIDELLAQQGLKPRSSSAPAKPAPKTVEQVVRDSHGPNLDEIKLEGTGVGASLGKPAAPVKPSDIYQAAKLPASPFTAEQMLEMLASLPPELPLETRRATVKVTLGALGKSVGATPETIVADASRKMAALAAYNEHLSKRASEMTAREEAAIIELQQQIEAKKEAMAEARRQQAHALQMSQAESARLDDVLEFFSLDVPPSKYAAAIAAQPAQPQAQPQAQPRAGASAAGARKP